MLIWPIITYGSSTGHIPIQVNIIKSAIKNQNKILDIGRNWLLLNKEVCVKGKVNHTNNDAPKAKTPSNLFGILRKIA